MPRPTPLLRRREFLQAAIGSLLAFGSPLFSPAARGASVQTPRLLAGQAQRDISPPLGIELGGFHRRPGQERRVQGIRQPPAVRALVLQYGETRVTLISADIAGAGHEMAARIHQQVQQRCGICEANVRFCATHTHSMPGFFFMRQWGALPAEFMHTVEQRTVEAVAGAVEDLAPAELSIGKARAVGGNFNRTSKEFKTDAEFDAESTAENRWLDTALHTLQFRRSGDRQDLLWYHFSAHPVCFADEQAGPDWPGLVVERVQRDFGVTPSFLQGHIGDVNPGDGTRWRGDANETTAAVFAAFRPAMDDLRPVDGSGLTSQTRSFGFPLDQQRFRQWLAAYEADPDDCSRGVWVDAGFAKSWYEDNANRPATERRLKRSLSALQFGEVRLLFHPAELYSFYGLAIRRDSPFQDTLVVGYTDGLIGYLPDPMAFDRQEYSAIVVPKILDYPPFQKSAAHRMASVGIGMLRKLKS